MRQSRVEVMRRSQSKLLEKTPICCDRMAGTVSAESSASAKR
jgi:hypothetical protein